MFALWADLCLLEFLETPIFVDAWVPSESPAVSSGGGGTAGRLGSNNMRNTTCSDSVASSLLSRLGGMSGRALFPSGDDGQRNIQSFFSARKRAPAEAAIEQAVEDEYTLLASKEAAHMARLIARQETFDAAAHLKLVPQEKGVTWSPASNVGTGEDDTSDAADDLPPQRGTPHNSSAQMTKVDRLAQQLAERERIAAAASAHAASVRLRGSTIAGGTVSTKTRSPYRDMALEDQMSGSPAFVTPAPATTPALAVGMAEASPADDIQRDALLSDLAALRRDAQARGQAAPTSAAAPLSATDSISGLLLITPDRPSALNALNYSSTPHNSIPRNEVDEAQGETMFSMSHVLSPAVLAGPGLLQPASPTRRITLQSRQCYMASPHTWTSFPRLLTGLSCTRWTNPPPSLPLPTTTWQIDFQFLRSWPFSIF